MVVLSLLLRLGWVQFDQEGVAAVVAVDQLQ
jgi:hypothetical protein